MKVLIADDESVVLEGLKYIIDWDALGFSICSQASNGEETLKKILNLRPELVLLDIRMPRLSGIEIIQIAREKGFDGRFSRENKAWAKSQPLPPDPERRGRYCSYVVDRAHPVLTDALVTHARRELEKKPSVKEKLQSAETPPRSAAKAAVPEL